MRVGNVRAVISGHIHDFDRIEVAGHTFICSGSVSGQQWSGPLRGTQEGFEIIDCQPNGTFNYQYYDYGWEGKVAKTSGVDKDASGLERVFAQKRSTTQF